MEIASNIVNVTANKLMAGIVASIHGPQTQ